MFKDKNSSSAILENRKFRSILFHYFRLLSFVLIPLIIIFISVVFMLYNGSRKSEVESLLTRNFGHSSDVFSMICESFESDIISLSGNDDFITVASASAATADEKHNNGGWYEKALKRLRLLCAGNSLYDSISFYCENNGYIISWLTYEKLGEYYDSEFISENFEKPSFSCVRFDPFSGERIITVAKKVYCSGASGSNSLIGTAFFNLRYDYIAKMISNPSHSLKSLDVITAPDGSVLYSSHDELLGHELSSLDIFSEEELGALSYGIVSSLSSRDGIRMGYEAFNGFKLFSSVDSAEYSHIRGSLYWVVIVSVPLFMLLSLLLAVIISFNLYGYILKIIESFQNPISTDNAVPESRIIRPKLLSAVEQHQTIESEFASNLAKLRLAQTTALQMQINPHFLLNTLNIINLNIINELHGDSVSTELISLLSDILRSNLSTQEYLTDFSSEITLAQKYLQIETIRRRGQFRSEWTVDPRVENMTAVKFTLQPLLENCLRHGFFGFDQSDMLISVSAALEEREAVISISDNGRGISPERLDELRAILASGELPGASHIGLCNVNMRLRLIFGLSDCIGIESHPDKGTCVTLRIPAIPYDELSPAQRRSGLARKEDRYVQYDNR